MADKRIVAPLAFCLALAVAACAGTGSGGSSTHELRAGGSAFGTTTEREGSVTVNHSWTIQLTDHDVVLTRGDRTVVLESVVGSRPIVFHERSRTGSRPDVVFELSGGVECRWQGTTIDVGPSHYDIPGPGTFAIDANGTMRRR
jgi:hypothetical protein